ncbi:uncharacterized protein LOC126237305 [Schistocerca nitens]|uniref:uncharacterized protein LOC126237305 n=1 Tax=Schistocerca nitens TaxID=7011 RepID=UPI002118252E|nr:uncharacterized protein LOC126237305 [Schistocerca nitens]
MSPATLAIVVSLAAVAAAQYKGPQTTPVPILKQINRHNDDGSYSYGYEAADGSFKIETKHPTGEVYGKYGYVDDSGHQREIEYGASRRGFEPAGTGINVPPPTLQNTASPSYDNPDGYDDGQYREDPSVYYKSEGYNSRPSSSFRSRPAFSAPPPPPPPPPQYSAPAPAPAPAQNYYNPPPQNNYYNPPPQQHRYFNQPSYPRPPISVDPNIFRGHPASNFDVNTGSYTITYSGR